MKSMFTTRRKEERKTYRDLRRIERKLKGLELGYSDYKKKIIVYLRDFKDLTLIRGKLRKALGKWTDEVEQIWASGDTACVSWQGIEHERIQIWMTGIPFDDFPESLHRPGCGFKEVEKVEMAYACEISDD